MEWVTTVTMPMILERKKYFRAIKIALQICLFSPRMGKMEFLLPNFACCRNWPNMMRFSYFFFAISLYICELLRFPTFGVVLNDWPPCRPGWIAGGNSVSTLIIICSPATLGITFSLFLPFCYFRILGPRQRTSMYEATAFAPTPWIVPKPCNVRLVACFNEGTLYCVL